MNITIPKASLLALVSSLARVADPKSTMPVCAAILLVGKDGALRASATDLYQAATDSREAKVTRAGSVCLNAKDLEQRVKAMPDGDVMLTVDEHKATLKAAGSPRRYTMQGMAGDQFPKVDKPSEGAPGARIPAPTLARIVAQTMYAVSDETARAHVNSLYVEVEKDLFRAVSTDGRRLAKSEAHIEGLAPMGAMLIPLKAVAEIKRIAESAKDGEVLIQREGPSAFFTVGAYVFSTKLVDATFPPYEQVIPKNLAHPFNVAREALADAIRAVSLAAPNRTGGVTLVLGDGKLAVTSSGPESGDGFDELPVERLGAAGEVRVGFNGKYWLDALGAMVTDEVTVGFGSELDPATVRQVGADGPLAIIMPMRI